MTSSSPSILWLRQDLRLSDHPALVAAAGEGPVVPVYVLDDDRPGEYAIGGAQRWWLHHSLAALADAYREKGVELILRRGDTLSELMAVAHRVGAQRIHAIRHYEPWWRAAQEELAGEIELCLHDGNHLVPPADLLTGSHTRYRIFTPYWKALLQRMPPPLPLHAPGRIEAAERQPASDSLADWHLLPTRPDWSKGFADPWAPGEAGAKAALRRFLPHLDAYDHDRNLPSIEGSSRLSPHLHFGEISPATVWHRAAKHSKARAEPFLREIAWRDFATNLIDIFPDYATRNGRDSFDEFHWRGGKAADADFVAWTRGRTGYPIVDAGMRQLWATGWMHNRVRMIAASFLIKHLLIDWRRGERWFWDTLVDADYGNNAANWQWVAGTGVDSNMFPRIMAPLGQSEKFDAEGYIRQWVPELAGLPDDAIHDPHGAGRAPRDYPAMLIGHRDARERALAAYRTMGS